MNNNNYVKDKNKIVKLPHMFQRSINSKLIINEENSHFDENLTKIVKKYQNSNVETSNSVIDSVKNLLSDGISEEEKKLKDFITEINDKYKYDMDEEIKDEESIPNIEEILKSSEQTILNTKDQKSLLKNLIDDININSKNKVNYDEEKFANNMAEIINDSLIQDESAKGDSIEKQEQNNNNTEVMKKRRSPFIFVFLFIIVLCITGYVYRDMIVNLIKSL